VLKNQQKNKRLMKKANISKQYIKNNKRKLIKLLNPKFIERKGNTENQVEFNSTQKHKIEINNFLVTTIRTVK
jgi:hypothetical protein